MAASSASDAQNLISQSSKDDNLDNLHSSSQKNEENQNTHDNDDNAPKEDASKADAPKDDAPKKSWRFWAIIVALSVTGLLTALEATITSTALPTIIDALGGASLYVWVINLYFLTMYVPFYSLGIVVFPYAV